MTQDQELFNSLTPFEISRVTRANLFTALGAVRGYLKSASMLWMQALGLPILNGIIVPKWSKASATQVHIFCKRNNFSELLLRIDKPDQRWTKRRGGYIVSIAELPATVDELCREGMISVLLEPFTPYQDEYSLTAVSMPDRHEFIIEVVGPGFDASDILRSDIGAHERWRVELTDFGDSVEGRPSRFSRVYLVDDQKYAQTVQERLAKIGARLRNPAFPRDILDSSGAEHLTLVREATEYLQSSGQDLLLKGSHNYLPIPRQYLEAFVNYVIQLISGLSSYGIQLGPTSISGGILERRGLIFWDFFPADC